MSEHENHVPGPGPHVDDPTAAGSPAPGPAAPPPSPPPPRSVRPWIVAAVAAGIAASVWIGTRIGGGANAHADGEEETADADGAPRYYTCGMHPWVVLPKPGPCPICGMDLVPLDPAKFSGEVAIDPVVVQNIGVRVAPVIEGPLVQEIRTVGTIEYDETRVRDVNVKIPGWVQTLHVDTLGQPIRKGDPLFELYSPELYAAQQEFLLAARGGSLGSGGALLEAARTKLEYYDVPRSEIRALEKRGKARKTMTLRSPYTGVVTEKKTVEGMRLEPGMQVFRIADLSKVWVMATVYESQLPFVRVGQEATITLPYLAGEELRGEVVYVYPYLDRKARQAQVRIELENPGLKLKPGMYATVALEGARDEPRVLAPRESVIDTGARKVAFVSKGGGRFEPREVHTGLEIAGGRVEVLEGLAPGEEVVTSGQFLLDSEAKVREALAKMIRGDVAAEPEPPPPPAAAPSVALPPQAGEALGAALEAYLRVGDALASDDLAPVRAGAGEVAAAVERLAAVDVPGSPHFWHEHDAAGIAASARAVADAKGIDEARKAFATLSVATARLVHATGVPPSVGRVDELHCPMYGPEDGATWLQAGGAVRNPYFGEAMLACSDRRSTLPAAGERAN